MIPPDLKDRVAALERAAPNVPAVFHHLFSLLPPPGEDFPADKRLAFLRAAANLANMVYGSSPLRIEPMEEATEFTAGREMK